MTTMTESTAFSISCPMENLPNCLLGDIMVFAEYGANPGESTCPAARFASVSKRWHAIYRSQSQQQKKKGNDNNGVVTSCSFLTQEEEEEEEHCHNSNSNSNNKQELLFFKTRGPLICILDWTIPEDTTFLPTNPSGKAHTIVDSWVRPPGCQLPCLWTSNYNFEGGPWRSGRFRNNSIGGPFGLQPGCAPPHLIVTFAKPNVVLRAIAIAARNRPRLLRLVATSTSSPLSGSTTATSSSGKEECPGPPPEERILAIPPPSRKDRPESGLSPEQFQSPQYMEIVARELPFGFKPPSLEALTRNSALPVVLPEPLWCKHGQLSIYVLESHERGWVGINHMALFELRREYKFFKVRENS